MSHSSLQLRLNYSTGGERLLGCTSHTLAPAGCTHTHTHSGTHTYSCGQWKRGLNAGGHIATFRPNQITLRSRGLSLFYITIRKWSRVAFSRLTLLPVSCKLTGYITKKICFPHYFRYKREMYVLCCFMRQSYVCKEIIFVS